MLWRRETGPKRPARPRTEIPTVIPGVSWGASARRPAGDIRVKADGFRLKSRDNSIVLGHLARRWRQPSPLGPRVSSWPTAGAGSPGDEGSAGALPLDAWPGELSSQAPRDIGAAGVVSEPSPAAAWDGRAAPRSQFIGGRGRQRLRGEPEAATNSYRWKSSTIN
jgi:hypothetical protein